MAKLEDVKYKGSVCEVHVYNQRCHSSGLNRNSVFCFNPFFPGRPFIKRPEEKKGNGNLLLFFF